MRRLLSLVPTAFLLAACGLDPTMRTGGAREPDPAPGPASQDVAVIATCRVAGSATELDPSKMEIFRHAAGPGALRMSIEKLPMTCADRVLMKAGWQLEGAGRLTLDVRGDRYQRCLCSVDFAPFDVAIPAAVERRLDAVELVVTRDGRPEGAPLRATTIGALPVRGQ